MNININKVKIFVTIPAENTDEVRDAVCKAGAGVLGNYSYCTTCVKTIGTNFPNDNAHPYVGNKNELDILEEDKLEFICDIKIAKNVIKELKRVHPYEEPAIDIVPLIDEDSLV